MNSLKRDQIYKLSYRPNSRWFAYARLHSFGGGFVDMAPNEPFDYFKVNQDGKLILNVHWPDKESGVGVVHAQVQFNAAFAGKFHDLVREYHVKFVIDNGLPALVFLDVTGWCINGVTQVALNWVRQK